MKPFSVYWFRALSLLWSPMLLCLAGCESEKGPKRAEFGLDTRPSNTTCLAQSRPVLNTSVALKRQWEGLTFSQPVFLTQAPGNNDEWFVVERQGTVRAFGADATSDDQTRTFATVDVNSGGEGGLLGMALHPEWPGRRQVYLSYTRDVTAGDPAPPACSGSGHPFTSVIARFESSDGTTLDSGPDEILKVGQPYGNHNGGGIAFGSDGYLYFGLGDGGSGGDPCQSGQDLTSLLGKMLRIDVDAPAGSYQVPDDNPLVGHEEARPEIWSYGLRNPWRWSFDRDTGELWVGDVGQDTREEIDLVAKGGNYGWNACEGFHLQGNATDRCNLSGSSNPVVAHARSEARSITGGYVYRGSAMPSLVGTYIYGDYATGNIWALLYDNSNQPDPTLIANVAAGTLVSFAQGNDGEIYTVGIDGIVSKLVPAGEIEPAEFPELLSETGCVNPDDPHAPAPGLIPYTVNAPLWSDGAEKDRFLAVPDGATITINEEQDWELPIGSVVMKTFSVGGEPVETRLFMRHEDGGWGGYSYEWDEDGQDATLLPAGKLKPLEDAAAWVYPSRSQCMQCHSEGAGGTIGLETAQLNGDEVYPSTNRISNQLATLDHVGMFSEPLGASPEEFLRLTDPSGEEMLGGRARSYLHTNCAHCHRPQGGGRGAMDLRYGQPLENTQTCDTDNTQGPVAGASKLIVPGSAADSILSLRLHATDSKRMPPVAVTVTDPVGTSVVDEWIGTLSACP